MLPDYCCCFLAESDPCTPDTPSATASTSSSEDPAPLSAPSSPAPSYDHEASKFSLPLPTSVIPLNPEMPPQTSASATLNTSCTLHPGVPSAVPPAVPVSTTQPSIYSSAGIPISPNHAPHLIDWLPYLASVMTTTMRGKEEEQPITEPSPAESMKRCENTHLPTLTEGGNAQPGFIKQQPPESVCSPPSFQDIPAHSEQEPATLGDILVELQTMNSHLSIIARALSQLAAALAPQQDSTNTPGL